MDKIKRTVEVEASYVVTTYISDGNATSMQVEDGHRAGLVALLQSSESGVIMSKVIMMYTLEGEPISEVPMIAIAGDPWFRETEGDTFMDTLIAVAEHACYDPANAGMEPEDFVLRVAKEYGLLEALPANLRDKPQPVQPDGSADRYHANLLRDLVQSCSMDGDPKVKSPMTLDPSERTALLEYLDRSPGGHAAP